MLRECNYAPDFIVQTCITINEHTHRCPHWKSGRVGARDSPCHQAHFQSRPAAHYNIGFPLSCHYHTLSLKADPKDRQSIRRESSHLYLLNVLMSSIFRPRAFAAGYWSRGDDRWCEVLDCRIRRHSKAGEGGNAVASLPLVSVTRSDHSLHRVCQSELRARSLWLQTDTHEGGGNRLGAKDIMVVMGLIIAPVMSLP